MQERRDPCQLQNHNDPFVDTVNVGCLFNDFRYFQQSKWLHLDKNKNILATFSIFLWEKCENADIFSGL